MKTQAILRIDPASTLPVYRQIVDGIRTLLVDRQLNPGDALPTVRELALELGVHFNTVAEAYRLLSSEGWLDLRRRRGAVVTARETPEPTPEMREQFNSRLRLLVSQMRSEGLSIEVILSELDGLRAELTK
jgi:DNA-binding transcriptional regulator YhcF (GntR family)